MIQPRPFKILNISLICILLFTSDVSAQILKKVIPNHLIVLTFDDATRSDYSFIAPILKKYGFGATFFVCEFPPDFSDTTKYMTWDQIRKLNEMGFEIGNHTWKHISVNKLTPEQFRVQVKYIENKCEELKIPKPVSFAYPAWKTAPYALKELRNMGYLFARAGGNRTYDPNRDHPYLIPSFNAAGTDSAVFFNAIRSAKAGKIAVMTFHGVPDIDHKWVNTPPKLFKAYMYYLHEHHYTVIAMRDLRQYINVEKAIKSIRE